MSVATLTPREVAVLSGAPKRLVEKAIEDRILPVRRQAKRGFGKRPQRVLPAHAVAYAALVAKLDLKLTGSHKRRLLAKLARLTPREMRRARVELAPAVEIDVGKLVGDAMERAEKYRTDRDLWIVRNEEIMGGTPVIRGTRMTVYSVLGRVDHGDTIDEILEENPDLARAALEAAVTYARAHPFLGRPGGHPWERAA